MRLKMIGLSLVAVFALTAVVSSSASAADPAFYSCVKLTEKPYKGKFTDKKCTVAATPTQEAEGKVNKYELQEGDAKGKLFKGKGGAATLHTPAVSGEVTCKSFKDSGKITGGKAEKGVLSTFTACVSLGKKCTTTGQKTGTIQTKALEGELGYINKATKEVGVALKAEGGGELANFDCEGLKINVTGGVIGHQTPINTPTKTMVSDFKINGEQLQDVTKLEGGGKTELLSLINGSGPFPSGQQATATNKGDELQLKA